MKAFVQNNPLLVVSAILLLSGVITQIAFSQGTGLLLAGSLLNAVAILSK